MAHQAGKTANSRSELEKYEDYYYSDLKKGKLRVKVSDLLFKCPFCSSGPKHDYFLEELLRHAYGRAKDSERTRTKDRARHSALERYLRKYHSGKVHAGSVTNRRCPPGKNDQLFVWPWMGVVANIRRELKDGRYVGESGSKLREELTQKGFNPVKVHPLWNHHGHSGFAIVEFNENWVGFCNALAFEKSYEVGHCGKEDYYSAKDRGDKLFGWVARDDDYNLRSIIGDHLRKKGDLRTLSDKEAEEQRQQSRLVADLQNTLEVKNAHLLKMKSKYRETKDSVNNLMAQKDEMLKSHIEGMQKIQQEARDYFESVYMEHEKITKHLLDQMCELQQHEKELELREVRNEGERMKLKHDKEMVKRAFLEQQKADEKVLRLAEEQKREKEELHKKIHELQSKLDAKQSLELEIERLRGALKVMQHMQDAEDEDLKKKMNEISISLKEKEEEMEYMDELSQALIIKERCTNDELQGARKELIEVFKDSKSRAYIGVKRMGELDSKPFRIAAKKRFSVKEADQKALELCSLWESYMKDPDWYPFKVITVGEKAEAIIDETDEKLKSLKDEYGDEVFNAVATAFKELNEYNGSGRYIIPELWNFKEGRKAALKEGAAYLLKQLKSLKRRKT